MTWLAALWASERARRVLTYAGLAVLVIALLAALWAYLSARENADDQHNQTVGAELQRADSMAKAIDNAEKANAAAENVRRDSDAARDECLQNARNPANC